MSDAGVPMPGQLDIFSVLTEWSSKFPRRDLAEPEQSDWREIAWRAAHPEDIGW